MLTLIFCLVVYVGALVFINSLFAMSRSLGNVSNSVSGSYECGFLPVINSRLRYRFVYWSILVHFILFEQELIIAMILVNGVITTGTIALVTLLLILLLIDMLL